MKVLNDFVTILLLRKFKRALRLLLLLVMTVGGGVVCHAQKVPSSIQYPNFAKCFDVLEKNRREYNLYNDSIFIIKDHDEWVKFFRRRALKNQQIYVTNKEIFSSVLGYFNQDKKLVKHEAYEALLQGMDLLYQKNALDPFVGNRICDILLDYYNGGTCPDSLNYAGWVDFYKGQCLYEMFTLGRDSASLRQSYQYFQRGVREDRFRSPSYVESCILILENLMVTNWLVLKMQTIDEFRGYLEEARQLLQLPKTNVLVREGDYQRIMGYVQDADERLVRNVYMADTTVLENEYADSLMRRIVEMNLSNPRISELSYSRTLLMQVHLGQMTPKQALRKAKKHYEALKKRIHTERFGSTDLRGVVQPYMNYFYLNDIADISYSEKRRRVRRLCQDIVMAYQHRKDQQMNNMYIKQLNTLATYPRAIKYLKENERIYYLNELNVATQVTTYAHSVHVAMIAKKMMEGILMYQPELLVGALGDMQVTEILRHYQKYLDFIQEAAMYHDVGKNAIISVVNNDYRPLTDEEFAIIKTHPERGAELLNIAPTLHDQFHDTTLGHHKWYNGKGGYPMNFDNTKSPMRIMIDIVTLADCMQAATERIGRNYKGDKTFDVVMGEFRRDAGVIYNPDLVALIDGHSDLAKKLANLIDDGWMDIYYDIYSQFIR